MAKKKSSRRAVKEAAAAVKKMSVGQQIVLAIVIIAIVAVAVYGYYQGWFDKWLYPETQPVVTLPATGAVSVHFLELGNDATGDSIYIKAGDVDILVDAGSDYDSADTIEGYVDRYCEDNTLEFVIVTHSHLDHIAGFAGSERYPSLFRRFECETIIDFPKTDNSSNAYNNYIAERDAEVAQGAQHYTALQCYNNEGGAQRIYDLSDDGSIKLEILYNYYYENKAPKENENEYSVCFILHQGSNSYLFTGDLESDGEERMVEYYNENHGGLPQCVLYKAGHHGSKTSSSVELLSQIKPQYAVVTCVAGSDEYTDKLLNQFPTQDFIERIAPYTDKVYVTSIVTATGSGYASMNGDVVFICDEGEISVQCSASQTLLKDTEWFSSNRLMPDAWSSAS